MASEAARQYAKHLPAGYRPVAEAAYDQGAAKALRDAAALVYADWSGGHAFEGVARQEVEDWLNDRADRIESQANEKGVGDDPL